MGLQIEGGGKGNTASVNDENKLEVNAIVAVEEAHVNTHEKEAYTAMFSVTPTGAGDCFGYITNTDDKDMMISTLMLRAASDETIQVKIGDIGTAVGGADITLVNRNAGSGKLASVTAQQGVDITGLAGGSVVAGAFIKGGESSIQITIASSIIVPKNKTISFYVATGTSAVMMGCSVFFHEHEHD